MAFAAEITLVHFFHVHLVRSLRHLENLIVAVAAPESFLIYMLFMAEENRPGILGSKSQIPTPDLLRDGAHRGQKASHDECNEKKYFHVHHLVSLFWKIAQHYNNSSCLVQVFFHNTRKYMILSA